MLWLHCRGRVLLRRSTGESTRPRWWPLAYLLVQQKDTFGLALFNEKVHSIAPRGSASHFRNVLDVLSRARGGGTTDISAALSGLAPQVKRRGLVVVLSDLVSETDRLGLGLGQMSFLGQDVVVFHVEDPIERDFPFAGQTIFLGRSRKGSSAATRGTSAMPICGSGGGTSTAFASRACGSAIQFEDMPTDAPLDVVLSGFLSLRQARRR